MYEGLHEIISSKVAPECADRETCSASLAESDVGVGMVCPLLGVVQACNDA